ncbi:FAD binding domain-containing protein [Desulfitobacterium metallireducens]|uniref:FAD-binding subunit of xanthine dehydrogenase n=1 Tax=Desulfitobacterium metallireducens DSM 15288 TaxID=871968 RepID=W0EB94_9FIRM|nr:FAD binding domain-containing protein [Desulfitobacterium metallireducens]AHF08135.1 FAD-binding subunit of xanthine dehydrogenase [Desulfitobacterium metallireducens DSM 15288]
MFTIRDLVQPETLEEAYTTLMNRKPNTVLGGCAFLKMGSKRIGTAIDLSSPNLDLKGIREHEESFEIGAMTTFREVETYPAFQKYFQGILPQAVRSIIGVQFRNGVTVGASVFSKYGFSDLITALLALDAEVELYHGGRMRLQTFLEQPYAKDILTKVWIPKNARKSSYQSLRNSVSDYAILNVAVSEFEGQWRIVVGARPQCARVADKASQKLSELASTNEALLSSDEKSMETIETIAKLAAEELSFGTNLRGSAEYRQALCPVLVKRAIMEVL